MKIFTIGFAQKSAERFFELLAKSGAERIIDIRLNNVSQLAGFTKKRDLAFFARRLCKLDYHHLLELAPTPELLGEYRESKDWEAYQKAFRHLLRERKVEKTLDRNLLDQGVLLCAEPKPEQCHRLAAAEYLAAHWRGVEIEHLL